MIQRILRLPQVKTFSGLSRSTIYLRISEGLFPRPLQLGRRMVGWPEAEIAALNAARIRGESEDDIRSLVRSIEAGRANYRVTTDVRSVDPRSRS